MLGQLEIFSLRLKTDYCNCLSLLNLDKAKMKFELNDFYLKYLSVVGKSKLLNYL